MNELKKKIKRKTNLNEKLNKIKNKSSLEFIIKIKI